MKPQIFSSRQIRITLFTAFFLASVYFNFDSILPETYQAAIAVSVEKDKTDDLTHNLDMALPVDHGQTHSPGDTGNLVKTSHHMDEEVHNHRFHTRCRRERRKRIHIVLIEGLFKLLITASYVSVLIYSYMCICH